MRVYAHRRLFVDGTLPSHPAFGIIPLCHPGDRMYKTIVVHVDGGAGQASRIAAAALLAREYGAHLVGSADTGLSWMDYAALTASIGAPIPSPDADFAGLRQAAGRQLDEFRSSAERLGVASYETRLVEDDTRHGLLLQSRYADLTVLSQDPFHTVAGGETKSRGPDAGERLRRLPEYVALHGVRPVLVVPQGWQDGGMPASALVAWDGSIQATRAITAALPLLQRVRNVRLAVINPDALSELHGEQPGADQALYLARHSIRVEVVVERTGATVGHALVALARDCHAGLMVAGAYGHSRYREWMLGGVTRELLERARTLLLLAH
jgi:nucleotide-binding universal stress UspA family protein